MSKYADDVAELPVERERVQIEQVEVAPVGIDPIEIDNSELLPQLLSGLNFNVSGVSYDSCDAQHLMHCYQLALDFGVPTAQRALAMYQSESSDESVVSKTLSPVES